MANAVARRAILRFGSFPDHTVEDLEQHALRYQIEAWAKGGYDPTKSAKSTFLYTIAWRKIQDLHGTLTCHRRHEAGADKPQTSDLSVVHEFADDADFIERAKAIHARSLAFCAERGIPLRQLGKRGRPATFTIAHAMTLFALRQMQKLTHRQAHQMFIDMPALSAAIALPRIPSKEIFSRSASKREISRQIRLGA